MSDTAPITRIKVMSYNINGLPWIIKKIKKQPYLEIGRILGQRRKAKKAPDIVLIQEGYRSATEEMVALSGYPHVYRGSKASEVNPYDLGKNGLRRALVGSGLWILSEHQITVKNNIVFGANRCAGYDCLSNKGIQHARIELADIGPVDFFNTHMNCYGASGCSPEKVAVAQKKQLQVAKRFIEEQNNGQYPVVFAGDFNIRTTDLSADDLIHFSGFQNVGLFAEKNPHLCQLGTELEKKISAQDLHNSPDQHLYRESQKIKLSPIYAAKTMGEKISGKYLSDHFAYEVTYQFYI